VPRHASQSEGRQGISRWRTVRADDLAIQGAPFHRDRYAEVAGEWKIQHLGCTGTFARMQSRKDRGWNVTQRGF
jgi:hypothetical protein